MKQFRLIIFCLVISLCGFAQTQDYLSTKNTMTSKGKIKMNPIVNLETNRISFVPVLDEVNKKALVIGPDKGIEGMVSVVLEKINHTTSNGTTRSIYYDGLEKNEKRIVIVTTKNRELISVSVSIQMEDNIFTLSYTNIKPVYREN